MALSVILASPLIGCLGVIVYYLAITQEVRRVSTEALGEP